MGTHKFLANNKVPIKQTMGAVGCKRETVPGGAKQGTKVE